MTILVTGGAGYIGSHTCVELLEAGYNLLVLDNLCNSSEESLKRVQCITGKSLKFVEGDLRDNVLLKHLFAEHQVEAVVHFAGLKAVGESVSKPLLYYQNNVTAGINLLEAMAEAGVNKIIFSSSATVYGAPEAVPITEQASTGPTNPYGQTKLSMENVLQDLVNQGDEVKWQVACLRYFNPVGAHDSGMIGEDPQGIPNNLLPYISKVAVGQLEQLSVFGDDYPTRDGTGVRDYIHVVDLARGHVEALAWLDSCSNEKAVFELFNLGTGTGYSVLEVIEAFERASGVTVPYQIVERRPGDIAECYANARRAEEILGWKAEKSLGDMMSDTWRWQKNNPGGY